jgi:osmotically-inducible protein OsmY
MNTRPSLRLSLVFAACAAAFVPVYAQDNLPGSNEMQGTELQVTPARTEPLTVTAPRATNDQLLQQDVMAALSRNPRLSGVIGVETNRGVVALTGRVVTPGMVRTAVREARLVDGVRQVNYDIRTRVGGSY